jgi:DNA invertase Pin-like site-specific DNA recombinase
MEAQVEAVRAYLAVKGWPPLAQYTEIESGRQRDRPQLQAALDACRAHRAVLVVAKLDRLARDASFLLALRDAGVEFVAVDMPHANRLTVGVMALVAEEEARAASVRMKAALAAAKARGVRLGGPLNGTPERMRAMVLASVAKRRAAAEKNAGLLRHVVASIRAGGVTSATGIAARLTTAGYPTPRGARTWQAVQVQRLLRHLGDTPIPAAAPAVIPPVRSKRVPSRAAALAVQMLAAGELPPAILAAINAQGYPAPSRAKVWSRSQLSALLYRVGNRSPGP